MSDRLPAVVDFNDASEPQSIRVDHEPVTAGSPKSQAMPAIAEQSESFSNNPNARTHVQALLDLRRDHYNLVNEKRKVDQELAYARQDNEVLLEAHNQDQIAIEELSHAVDAFAADKQALLTKCTGLEAQFNGLRKERDRLLEVSQGRRITISRSEKAANQSQGPGGARLEGQLRTLDNRTPADMEPPVLSNQSPGKPSP